MRERVTVMTLTFSGSTLDGVALQLQRLLLEVIELIYSRLFSARRRPSDHRDAVQN